MIPSEIEAQLFNDDDHFESTNFAYSEFYPNYDQNQCQPAAENSSSCSFSSIHDLLFGDEETVDNPPSSPPSSDPEDQAGLQSLEPAEDPNRRRQPVHVNPELHVSSQFYTFNSLSHALMINCLLEGRLATTAEICAVTPSTVLASWRIVWKDRNEDTAYITAWKRLQEKLSVHVDCNGNQFLCFRSNTHQFVSHAGQWQDIITGYHCGSGSKHLGLKETVEKIKQVWSVGAKFYGIPESFIRVCVAACPQCSSSSYPKARTKRRKFQYTESIDVPVEEVPHRLQQLAAKYKVVLCITQKYIRNKPCMAEVKDYACDRAGEPAYTKRLHINKRESTMSQRCGCGFRIRTIVPLANYNEKDKTLVYKQKGTAIFKLYAVHSGHEPGSVDDHARNIHQMVVQKGDFKDHEAENKGIILAKKGDADLHLQFLVLQQLQDLKSEIRLLEGRLEELPGEHLGSLSHELLVFTSKLRCMGHYSSMAVPYPFDHNPSNNHQSHQIFVDAKAVELVDVNEDNFTAGLQNNIGSDDVCIFWSDEYGVQNF